MYRQDEGLSFLELLVVVALIGIIAAFATPRLLRARMTANETSAIASIRAVASAEIAFSASCGSGAYAVDLPTLGVAPPGTAHAFLSAELTGSASPQKSGYNYWLVPGRGSGAGPSDCHGNPTATRFYASTAPASFGISGRRSFAVTANKTIWQTYTAGAPTEPFGPPAVPIQ
jgi:prepilin-type N-terminal cleavage/methylation domain-containing protein